MAPMCSLISPRPFQLMHSEKPAKLVHWFAEECHNIIHRQTQLYPEPVLRRREPAAGRRRADRGGAAGTRTLRQGTRLRRLPAQSRPVRELRRRKPPPLGDRYWYPLYEKLCELDIPAHIHTASSRSERASYSVHLINEGTIAILGLLSSDVFKDFPNLKIIVSHGGGAIPYQLGRFDAPSLRGRGATRFRDRLKLLYFDTVLYTAPALELLIKTVGPDRCLFGSECPGVGSTIDPDTGHTMDHIRPHIENFEWLSQQDRDKIFAGNARKVFKLKI